MRSTIEKKSSPSAPGCPISRAPFAREAGIFADTSTNRILRSPKLPRPITSACSSSCSPKNRCSPTTIFRPGRTKHSHSFGSCDTCRVSRTSIRPRRNSRDAGFLALTACARIPPRRPYKRAGNTRVLLKTTRSSARSNSGNSRNCRCSNLPADPCRCSIRDAARSTNGSWAINSSGRS